MIEINLIPDVKLELLRAQRQRRTVISISIVTAIVAGGAVVLLSVYAFGIQTVASTLADNAIKSEHEKLLAVEDLSKTLTIQNQISTVNSQHDEKTISSRLFDIISTAVPTGENAVSISRLSLDTESNTIEIEGEANNGYEALEVFKKTLAQTTFSFNRDGTSDSVNIADSIADGERRYGEGSDGERILRFSLSFTYPDELFSPTATGGKINAPDRQNATDSARGVPNSLFTDIPEGN
jgi:hypothetical protein